MTRIKDFMELLTSEMEGFQDDVNRLEAVNKGLKDLKVSIDIKELKDELQDHRNQLERQREHQERFYNRMELLFKNAGVYPRWAVITFIAAILISAAALFYAYRTQANLDYLKDSSQMEEVSISNPSHASIAK